MMSREFRKAKSVRFALPDGNSIFVDGGFPKTESAYLKVNKHFGITLDYERGGTRYYTCVPKKCVYMKGESV